MKWFRWYRGVCQNPIFAVIADEANQDGGAGEGNRCYGAVTVTDVIAVWAVMLEDAAKKEHWGTCTKDAKYIALVLRWWPDEVQNTLLAMEKHGLITINDGNIDITNWDKYQRFSKNDPTNAERQRRYRENKRPRNSTVTPLRNDAVTPPDTDTDTDSDTEKRTNNSLAQSSLERAFDDWWSVCWRKVGKKAAKQEYLAILKRGEATVDELRDRALAQSAHYDAERTETQFMCHPVTWLKQGRWKDDLTVRRKATQSEQLEEWAKDGNEGNNGGSREIDGECVEVSERQSAEHGGSVLPSPEGPGGRRNCRGGPVAIGELVEGLAAQAGGYSHGSGDAAPAAEHGQAPAASGADTRRDHGEDPSGRVPRPGDHGSPGGGEATRASPPLVAGGMAEDRGPPSSIPAGPGVAPIDLTPPPSLDRRTRR